MNNLDYDEEYRQLKNLEEYKKYVDLIDNTKKYITPEDYESLKITLIN
jgi:hypothetical protein